MKVRFFGVRGSMPAAGAEFAKYGGDTACVGVEAAGRRLLLDAGTGLLNAEGFSGDESRPLDILLSHAHLDHLLGLPLFPPLYQPGREIAVYGAPRGGLKVRAQVETLLAPPYWPTGPAGLAARVRYVDIGAAPFDVGAVRVEAMEGSHPGGCTVFRLACNGKSLVYCTDFEHGEPQSARLADFARDADLLVYDASYTDAEYPDRQGWGHSTWGEGQRLARACGAKRLRLFHHAHRRTNAELECAEQAMDTAWCRFARQGEEVRL